MLDYSIWPLPLVIDNPTGESVQINGVRYD